MTKFLVERYLPGLTPEQLAAAETVRETTGIHRPAARGAEQERTVAALRSTLGADAFARAWEVGRSLPLDESVADALAPAEPTGDSRFPRAARGLAHSPGGSGRWPR